MNDCLCVANDMIFTTRIRSMVDSVGAACAMANSMNQLATALSAGSYDLVLVDLCCETLDPFQAIKEIKQQNPTSMVLAYFPHVQQDLPDRARLAGVDKAVPRSSFFDELARLLGQAV